MKSRPIFSLYVPATIAAVAQNSILFLTPLYVLSLGDGASSAAFIIGVLTFSNFAMSAPSGWLVGKMGPTSAMIAGALALAISAGVAPLFATSAQLTLIAFMLGGSIALIWVSRTVFVTNITEPSNRGRTMAKIGGTQRLGVLLGPALTGVVISAYGFSAAYWLVAAEAFIAALLIYLFATRKYDTTTPIQQRLKAPHLRSALKYYVLAVVLVIVCLQALRSLPPYIIPIFGDGIGLDARSLGIALSLSSIFDLALFYPAGVAMDKFGRKYTAIPSLFVFALGAFALGVSQDWAGIFIAASLLAVASGLSSGLVMTIGADLAPKEAVGEFLGIWRTISDFGIFLGPVLLGVSIEVATIETGAYFFGLIGVAAGLYLLSIRLPK